MRFTALLAAGAIALAGTVPATAAVMQATYTATVFGSINYTGEFGVVGESGLDGLSAILVFLYDPSTPGSARTTNEFTDQVYGGSTFGLPSPMLSASITIGGVTRTVLPTQNATAQNTYQGEFSSAAHQFTQQQSTPGLFQQIARFGAEASGSAFGVDLDTPVATTLSGPGVVGYFEFVTTDFTDPNGSSEFVYGQLQVETLTITGGIPAVPLPAGAPLILTGLAALVGLGWRKRQSQRS